MNNDMKTLKPMGWWQSLLHFGIPALLFVAAFYWLQPLLGRWGMGLFDAYLVSLMVPLIILFAAALWVVWRDMGSLRWGAVCGRLRLKKLEGKDWLWLLIALVVGMVGFGLMSGVSNWLITMGVIPLPANLPAFMNPLIPQMEVLSIMEQSVGGLEGNWWPFMLAFVTLFFNIFGEEFWWRGVVLPRQELAFGKNTWWVHGLLWGFFHVFKYWDVLNLLPVTLILSLMAFRRKNTTPGIIMHYIVNGSLLVFLFAGALGLLGG